MKKVTLKKDSGVKYVEKGSGLYKALILSGWEIVGKKIDKKATKNGNLEIGNS